jgi:tricarballylate dehydrogenase
VTPNDDAADVIVVGAGNAAACAALAARDAGADVIMLESAPEDARGGNTAYTAGAMRFAYADANELASVFGSSSDTDLAQVDFGSYTESQFFDDMFRVTEFRTDMHLCEVLVTRSRSTLEWMRTQGVRFQPSLGRQAFRVDGKFKFWGGVSCEVCGGGPGLLEALLGTAKRKGIVLLYESPAIALLHDDDGVHGVRVRHNGVTQDLRAGAVVLACGGFESNAEMRARYLGPNWDLAKVRGTRFNTGAGIQMALNIGAMPYGHWSGAHSVAWDQNAPPFGDLRVGDAFQKHSYPFGIVVNQNGDRFLDEGADFRNYTYAKYGGRILQQPGMVCWQVFDSQVRHLLRDEYRIREVTKVEGGSIEDLAAKMDGVDARRFVETVKEFNRAVSRDVQFNPNIKDGKGTVGLTTPKSNWANAIEIPPFEAYAVTCGVTFTFGGLKISTDTEVEDSFGTSIPGLYAAGELVGGLFYHNYPGGTGLTSGAVFGKIAGERAASFARQMVSRAGVGRPTAGAHADVTEEQRRA